MALFENPDDPHWRDRGPGVYFVPVQPLSTQPLRTSVPVFLARGNMTRGNATSCPAIERIGGPGLASSVSSHAAESSSIDPVIRGFFANGGKVCYVAWLDSSPIASQLDSVLDALRDIEEIDLVCAPDLAFESDCTALQSIILEHCDQSNDRFVILDAGADADLSQALEQWRALQGTNGALYFPHLAPESAKGARQFIPPCGHIAGSFAMQDAIAGVFRAPANLPLQDVRALKHSLDGEQQFARDPSRAVNLIRMLPGRGFRVWGARTVSNREVSQDVSVRRLLLTLSRWFRYRMADLEWEPNNARLRNTIERRVRDQLLELHRRGALQGEHPQDAFFVRCPPEVNTPEAQANGRLIAEVGLAISVPAQFIIVQLSTRPARKAEPTTQFS